MWAQVAPVSRIASTKESFEPPSVVRSSTSRDALAGAHGAFDTGVLAVAFGFFAHVGHWQGHALGHEGGERNARCLAACDIVKGFKASVAHHCNGQKIHQCAADAREADQLATVNIAWRGQTRGERIGLVCVEVDSANFKQHAGCETGDFFRCGVACRDHVQAFALGEGAGASGGDILRKKKS